MRRHFTISWGRSLLLTIGHNPYSRPCQVWARGDYHTVHLDRLTADVVSWKRGEQKEFLKGCTSHKLCKMLLEHREIEKKRVQKHPLQRQGWQSEYSAVYQSNGPALHPLPSQILRALQDLQKKKPLGAVHNGLGHPTESPSKNRQLSQEQDSIPLNHLKFQQQDLREQYIFLLERGRWKGELFDSLGLLLSLFKSSHLLCSIYLHLNMYSIRISRK